MSSESRVGCAVRGGVVAIGMASLVVSCASINTTVPPELRPADAGRTVAVMHAIGVQIYVCKRAPDGRLLWTFKAPEATLRDEATRVVIKHYAGPTWEAPDGSKVTGKVLQQAANTRDPNSIPLLLLQATSTGGAGLFRSVRYVQRLNTQGGLALPPTCTQEGQEDRMPYQADYVFIE
ncbi:Protein of unknown function [Cupriavidus sp. YR651]|uniref:DUF3455 domain-containing protein n=1 Tax=Cupriavidus sp. YR651 TaxID=1855315 RepID=UPI000882CE5C|nr:DUF3455 domain-containing protein [Cupriavidus sp. YR651]SDC89690.1 Protein of unknown function [Cupriavidus sp. YR651]